MLHKTQKSIKTLAVLLALTAVSPPTAITVSIRPTLAQSSQTTDTKAPTAVPSGTIVKIDGSDSMANINKALAEDFKTKYPGTNVEMAYNGTDAALQAVADGKIDIAAIGRPLTEEEKAKGLVAKPLTRHKIALIVGPENPFKGDLKIEQFAQIFRGEITDWSKVGGAAGGIRMIDRPESSDTRQAFNIYPVFQKAPLKTGANAVTVTEDSTDTIIKELGKDGIGYAIADQVVDNTNVRVISMHNVLPDDARYPFSQPLYYVYKGQGSPAALAFLGYAVSPENQATIEEARQEDVAVVPAPEATPTTSPTTTATETETEGGFPWWILLPILLLGIPLLWWLFRDKGTDTDTAPAAVVPPVVPPIRTSPSRIILTPRNCREAYAYWEVPDEVRNDLQRQGGRDLKLRLYDVTDINIDSQTPYSIKEIDCEDRGQDRHIPIEVDNRDYLVELGYHTEDDGWLRVARSEPVRVPACEPLSVVPAVTSHEQESRIALTPRNSREAYAYWEVSEDIKNYLRKQGGRDLKLRLYDVTDINIDRQEANSVREFDCDDWGHDAEVSIPVDDRDYLVELGYLTEGGRWLKIARSEPVRVPASEPDSIETERTRATNLTGNVTQTTTNWVDEATGATSNFVDDIKRSDMAGDVSRTVGSTIAAGAGAAAGLGGAARSWVDRSQAYVSERTMERDCRIILVLRNTKDAYAYWEVSDDYKVAARRQGGERMMLRVHDATNIDIDAQPPHSTQEYPCTEAEQDKHIPILVSDRDYIAELGYYTDDNRWLRIIRSFHVHVPADSTLL